MVWGSQGTTETIEGASGRTWTLRFERRLAPREGSNTVNPASTVWLVRDEQSARLFAAKRQILASASEVDLLVDEAAAWRAACLADTEKHVVELLDVFVERDSPYHITFLAEFCSRGLLPKKEPLSEPVLLTIIADLAAAAAAIPSPHAHISYESLLVDETGRIRLSGFGAHRSAILRDNPGLTPSDDAFDIGLLIYELIFGQPPPDSFEIPPSSYSERLTDIINTAFSHPHPSDLKNKALAAGAEAHAPVVNVVEAAAAAPAVAEHVARATERNVDRLVSGIDIAAAFSALLKDVAADPDAVSHEVFQALFKKPISKDPLCAMRILTMLHNITLDGPDAVTAAIRKNDKFMAWVESSWTRESIEDAGADPDQHAAVPCFAGGELAFYAAFLRRKSRFHMLAAGGLSGKWDRTGAVSADGRDVVVARRRKVIAGMADVIEMASELGCQLAGATDEEAAVKHTALGALISECCLAFNAAYELAREVVTVREAEKLTPSINRLYDACRKLVFAVETIPSAGGEQWVEQFGPEEPPNLVAEKLQKEQQAQADAKLEEFPEEVWAKVDAAVQENEPEPEPKEKKPKKKKEKKKKKSKKPVEAVEAVEEEKEITAADGALVVHGEDQGAAAVKTMFGDLLKIDPGTQEAPKEEAPRPLPDMSNAQALASAFGVPEEAVGGSLPALPPPEGFDDDYGDEGGYEDFRARQEQQAQEAMKIRNASSTAAWAARSGYGERAVVVSNAASMPKKSHPAICQCALCEQEEKQNEAQQHAERRQTQPMGGSDLYDMDDAGYGGNSAQPHQFAERPSYLGDMNRADSLDDENGAYGNVPQRPPPRTSFYDDDYDSYESISYSVEREQESASNLKTTQYEASIPRPFALSADQKLNLKKLRVGDKISSTESLTVSKGEYNREVVAVKKLSKAGMASGTVMEEFENEVRVMLSLSHPNVLKCKGALLQKGNFVFVTEFMKRGTLFDVLHKSRIKLTWALIRKIGLQVAQGMAHIHERGYLHRDLKSLNILVDSSYNAKVGDLGLACHTSSSQGAGISGTYQYMSPEVLRGEHHTFESDVFAYGHVLCEMVSGTPPFQGFEARQIAERVVSEDLRPTIPPTCQRAFANIIQSCWRTVPSTRPSFGEVVNLINTTTK